MTMPYTADSLVREVTRMDPDAPDHSETLRTLIGEAQAVMQRRRGKPEAHRGRAGSGRGTQAGRRRRPRWALTAQGGRALEKAPGFTMVAHAEHHPAHPSPAPAARPAGGHPRNSALTPQPSTRSKDMSEVRGLYRTTVTVWTTEPAGDTDLAVLAREATDGGAYCSGQRSVLVPCPEADPEPPGAEFFPEHARIPVRLLCDRCFEAVTGEQAQCQPGCRDGHLDDDGACLWPEGPAECQSCGYADRLTPVPAGHAGFANLPTVGDRGEGQWRLNWPRETKGPYPSPDAAWAAWHAGEN